MVILLLLLATTNWGLSPQNLGEGPAVGRGHALGLGYPLPQYQHRPRSPNPLLAPPTPQHSLLSVDLHVVLGAGAQGHVGLQQVEEFEEHLHVSVVGHLKREMLLGPCCFFPSFLNPRMCHPVAVGRGKQGTEHGCCGSPLRPMWATCHTQQAGQSPHSEELPDPVTSDTVISLAKPGKLSRHYRRQERAKLSD